MLSVDESRCSCQLVSSSIYESYPISNEIRALRPTLPLLSPSQTAPLYYQYDYIGDIHWAASSYTGPWNVGADSTDPRTNSSPIIRTVIGTIARICAPYITGANSTLVILILEDVPPRCSTLLRNNPLSSDYSFSLPLSIRLRSACPAIPPSTSTTYAAPNPPFPPSPFCHDSPHKCMFPGFLVVRRMSYGRSATNARLRRRHRRDCGTRGVKIVGERRRKAARLIGLEKNGGFSLFLLCCSLLNPTNERSYFL